MLDRAILTIAHKIWYQRRLIEKCRLHVSTERSHLNLLTADFNMLYVVL